MKNNEFCDGTGNLIVKLRKNENTDSLIRRFLKKTKKERIIEECLDRKKFKTESQKRREAKLKRKITLNKLKEKEKLDLQFER